MLAGLLSVLLLFGGCASRAPERDGAGSDIPADLQRVPDAVPRVEPLRVGGPNKPYEVLGVRYEPHTSDVPLRERGLASWYGAKFHGKPTSSGEPYDMYAMTAAHKTMPLPSYARVRNPANGREIIVRVNDRGPFHAGRVIDLSYTAALKLGVLNGVAPVEVERLTHADIRAGLPSRPMTAAAPAVLPTVSPIVSPTPAPATTSVPAPVAAQAAAASGGFFLQLGAFRERDGALQLQRLLQREAPWLAPLVAVLDEAPWVRVQAGPWPDRGQAESMAARLAQALPLQALVVRRP
jgi:rare lipoprotein A